MATYKFHFRPSSRPGLREGKLFIRVIHERIAKNVRTGYAIFPHEWDDGAKKIVFSEQDNDRTAYLIDLQDQINDDMRRLKAIEKNLSCGGSYTACEFIDAFEIRMEGNSLLAYTEFLGRKLREDKRLRTARAYRTVANGLVRYNSGQNLALAEINSALLLDFQEYLRSKGRHFNTISFYMRNLRAIYNRAVRDKRLAAHRENPFSEVYTGISDSTRRALPLKDVARLHTYSAEIEQQMQANTPIEIRKSRTLASLYRTLRLFRFCCEARGMSFVDLVFLMKSDISDGKIHYMRKKTKQILTVKITDEMQHVIDGFGSSDDSPYVFPFLDLSKPDLRLQYESALRAQNKRLNKIGINLGFSIPLTTHVARHTWATLAKWSNIELAKISEGLGHSSIKTTVRYLDSFEESVMDQISDQIADVLKFVA